MGTVPSVNINPNGGTYSSSLDGWTYDSDSKIYSMKGVEITLPAAPTAPTGKEFVGWEYGTQVKQPGDVITPSDGANITYTAKYESLKYTVSFDVMSHGTAPDSLTNVEYGTTITEPTEPSEKGYTFEGWYKENAHINAWDFDTDTIKEATILYAKWTANTYDVTFDKNGGDTEADSKIISETYDSKYTLPTTAPTKTGYTFAGWFTDATEGTQVTAETDVTITETQTLYAHWTSNAYTIAYYDQGGDAFTGTHESGYATEHTYGTDTALKSATKTGYAFGGWYTSSDCSGSAITSLGATEYNTEINLYAKWTEGMMWDLYFSFIILYLTLLPLKM